MKKLITIIAFAATAFTAQAQQEALFSQYVKNPLMYNPAVAGSSVNNEIRLYHRWQWVSFPGAPITIGLNFHTGYKNNGFGADVYLDNTGPTRRYGASLMYAYHLPVSQTGKLAMGISGRFLRYEVNTSQIHFNDQTDPIANLGTFGSSKGDATAGLYYYTPKMRFGIAAANLIQTKLEVLPGNGDAVQAQYYRHYFASAAMDFGKEITFTPNAFVRFTGQTPLQYEVGCRAYFNEHDFGIGMAYRGGTENPASGFMSFSFNTIFEKQYPLIISFDVATTPFSNYSSFAYELMTGADWQRRDIGSNYMTTPQAPEGKK